MTVVSVVNLQLGSVAAAVGNMMVSQTDDEHIELFLEHTFEIKMEIFYLDIHPGNLPIYMLQCILLCPVVAPPTEHNN